ncbi:retron St85 family effector protein [Clostridium perfringens]
MNNYELFYRSIDKLYNEVYKKINREYIDVFLCGGVSTNSECIRDKVREIMERNNIRVLYPEDMFMDILTKNRDKDLLSLEKFLAENSDIICVLPESAGSFVELGAFTNNNETLGKLFVMINRKYEKDKSFIIMGPVKYIINKKGKERIIFYKDNDIDRAVKKIREEFKRFIKENGKQDIAINTIIGQYYFIPLLLFFIKRISLRNLYGIITEMYNRNNIDMKQFKLILGASIKLLYKHKLINKHIIYGTIALTDKGNDYIKGILRNLPIKKANKLFDYIRYGIILSELNGNAPLESTVL